MSNLINTPDDQRRAGFLASCRQHLTNEGSVLIQQMSPELAERINERINEQGECAGEMGGARSGANVAGSQGEAPAVTR